MRAVAVQTNRFRADRNPRAVDGLHALLAHHRQRLVQRGIFAVDQGARRTAFDERAVCVVTAIGKHLFLGLQAKEEVFADRGYNADGSLVKRGTPGALIDSEDAALDQTLTMVREQRVKAIDGTWVPIRAETVCLHGDGAHALAFARRIRERLGSEGIAVRAGA